ncbi:MAG: rod shape-determining protein MreC, partial [Terriglobia bacterium]
DAAMMLEVNSSVHQRPVPPRAPETPQVLQAFIANHAPFFVLIAVLILQLLFLAFQATRKHNVRVIKVWAVAAFDPFERSVRGLADAVSAANHSFGDYSRVEQENRGLQQQLASARAEARQLAEEGAENGQLRALLNLQRRLPLRTLSAEVIAASPGAGSAIYIDRGTRDGLTTDMAVITPDGVAGKTVAVFPHTAQVLLLTDSSSGAGAMLEKSRDEGVLKGSGDDICLLDYISNGTAAAPGDKVVTSGLDQIYPKGLLLGLVAGVREGNVYRVISVKPAINLDRLEDVLVILSQKTVTSDKRPKAVTSDE